MNATVIPRFDPKDIHDHKAMAALSYIGILCFIPLITLKSSRFAQEHAKQGTVLLIVWIIGSLAFWIPLFGQLAAIVVFIANIIALMKCLNGEFWEIPVIGAYRSKVNL